MALTFSYDKRVYAPGDTVRLTLRNLPAPNPVIAEAGWVCTAKTATTATFTTKATTGNAGKLAITMGTKRVRIQRPLGTYDPDQTTCGAAATGAALKIYPATGGPAGPVYNGVLTIKDAGAVLSGYDIRARVDVRAKNVKLLTSIVRGNPNDPKSIALVRGDNAACVNLLLQDVTLQPSKPMPNQNGFFGHDTTFNRVDMLHVTDGIGAHHPSSPRNNIVVKGSRISRLAGHCPDYPLNRPMTHNDCIQLHGGSYLTVLGSVLEAIFANDIPSRDGTTPHDPWRDEAHKNKLGGWNPYYGKNFGKADPRVCANATIQANEIAGRPIDYVELRCNYLDGGIRNLNLEPYLGDHSIAAYNRFGARMAVLAGGAGMHSIKQVGNTYAQTNSIAQWQGGPEEPPPMGDEDAVVPTDYEYPAEEAG